MDLISKEAAIIALMDAESDQIQTKNGTEVIDVIQGIPTIPAIPLSVIDGIKAEIWAMTRNEKRYFNDFARAQAIAFECCLEIISKHIKEHTDESHS